MPCKKKKISYQRAADFVYPGLTLKENASDASFVPNTANY